MSQQESLLYNQNKEGKRTRRENSANLSNALLLTLNFNPVNIAFSSHFCAMKILYIHLSNSCFSSQISEGVDKELKVILCHSQCESMSFIPVSTPQEKQKLILFIHKIPWQQILLGTSEPYRGWCSTCDTADQKAN